MRQEKSPFSLPFSTKKTSAKFSSEAGFSSYFAKSVVWVFSQSSHRWKRIYIKSCIWWLLYWFVSTGHYLFHIMLWRSWPILAWKEPSEAKHTLVLCRGFGLGLLLFFAFVLFFCHRIAMGLVSSSCTMMMTTMKTIPCGGATCCPLAEKMKFVQSCIEETL